MVCFPQRILGTETQPQLEGERGGLDQPPGAKGGGGTTRPWASRPLKLQRLKNLAHLAVPSACPPLPQHRPKPVPFPRSPTRASGPQGPRQPPRTTHAPKDHEPVAPPPRRGPQQLARALAPGSHNTWDPPSRNPGAGQWGDPSASSREFPQLFASPSRRLPRQPTPRPGPTAQLRLVYSLTLHPETQAPATRTPARCGHAPAPRPRPASPPPCACALGVRSTWASFLAGV